MLVLMAGLIAMPGPFASAEQPGDVKLNAFLERFCLECHGEFQAEAGLNLETLAPATQQVHNAELWQEVVDRLTLGDMPPADAFQPTDADKLPVLRRLREDLEQARQAARSAPEVVLRRLNRQEYNNTMRDLTGLDLRLGDRFPADIAVDGFDNIGEALTVSPYLMEQTIEVAEEWLDEAILTERPDEEYLKFYGYRGGMGGVDLDKYRRPLRFDDLSPKEQAKKKTSGRKVTDYVTKFEWNYINIPHTGRYRFRLLLSGRRSTDRQPMPRMQFVVASGPVAALTIPCPAGEQSEPQWFEFDAWLPAGVLNFRGEFLNPEPKATRKRRKGKVEDYQPTSVMEHWSEIRGPLYESWPPESTRGIMPPDWIDRSDEVASAQRVLKRFMRQAWRRPVKADEVEPMVELFRQARSQCDSFEQAMKTPLVAVLTSPHFLYLVEPRRGDERGSLSDWELASRLSYFLWSTLPDQQLSELAESGQLKDPGVLARQTRRMLQDPRSDAFVRNFVGQWLRLRSLGSSKPDPDQFPQYNPWLQQCMRTETESFFRELIDADASVLNFIDSDFAMLNDQLAVHYGIDGVVGGEFRRVPLPDTSVRGGLLTQASVLTLTADGHETSPIHRGKWILESFLNTPPPPPPPNVPELEEVNHRAEQPPTTIREKLALHRASAACAGCHAKMDPLGFALEAFDAIGVERTFVDHESKVPVEAFGTLPDGSAFDGPEQFKQMLMERREEVFLRGLATNLMTYALGRPVGFQDRQEIDRILAQLKADDYRMSTLLSGIVTGEAFRMP